MAEREDPSDATLEALGEVHLRRRRELRDADESAPVFAELTQQEQKQLADAVLRDVVPDTTERRRSRSIAAVAGGFALAAATLLVVRWSNSPDAAPLAASYTLVPPPSDAELRSSAVEPPRSNVYTLGRELVFAIRPSTRNADPVVIKAFALGQAAPVELAPLVSMQPGGGALVTVTTGRGGLLDVEPGSWQLVFFVSPAGAPAATAKDAASGRTPELSQRFLVSIELRSPPAR